MVKKYIYGKDDLSVVFGRTQIEDESLIETVKKIVNAVKENGDSALFEYTEKFDKLIIDKQSICVTEQEIEDAYAQIDDSLLKAIRKAKENVISYHTRQLSQFDKVRYNENGNTLGWTYKAVQSAGIYIPGGKASYPSSIIMCAIPAIVSGVKDIYLVTPNPKNPLTLVTAKECGVTKIFKIGGAQAISALAYGTESVPKVDIIAGPGNVYVTLAKKQVFGSVKIDMIAGPSEILVIADESAKADYVAADMLSQAEHDEMSASILITTSKILASQVEKELIEQTAKLDRKEIATKSLKDNGAIIVVENLEDAIKISDQIAPEHLEICVKNAEEIAEKINNAGAIFVGNYSPEPLGDYFAGPSHCLPTSGTAKFFSVLSVDTFMKKISYIQYTKEQLLLNANDIISIAKKEGLDAHARAIEMRLEK